jgi:parallel beta-helix repeat protein
MQVRTSIQTWSNIMSYPENRRGPILALALMALAGAAGSKPAAAHYFCVSNSAQLQQALTATSDGGVYNNEDNSIELQQGLYRTGSITSNGPFFYYSTASHMLRVSGGFSANCVSQTRVASLTVLDGQHLTGVFALRSANGNLAINELTLQNGEYDQPGAGLQINYLTSVNAEVLLVDTIIRANHTSVDAGGLYLSGAGIQTWLFNSLITGNSADGQYGAGYVTGYGQFNEVFANTVTDNTSAYRGGSAPVGGLFCGGSRACRLTNNIFWNNTTYGLYLGNSGAALLYNDYGMRGGAAPASSIGDLSVAPRFIDPSAGNFRLSASSPLRDYSNAHLGGDDLDGHPYPTTGPEDIGAYQHQ